MHVLCSRVTLNFMYKTDLNNQRDNRQIAVNREVHLIYKLLLILDKYVWAVIIFFVMFAFQVHSGPLTIIIGSCLIKKLQWHSKIKKISHSRLNKKFRFYD